MGRSYGASCFVMGAPAPAPALFLRVEKGLSRGLAASVGQI